jgi:dsDNA-binding SOS-regulon protein
MKALTAIILIAASIGLFFFQINPTYSEVKVLRAQSSQYDHALEVAEELKKIRGELATKLSSFSEEELTSLEHFMPQQLDTVRIILDIDGIASLHNIQLKDIKTSEINKVVTAANQSPTSYSTTAVTFSFTTAYTNAEVFIRDLERSLRLVDTSSVSIKPSAGKSGGYDFNMTLNTYWIPKK